MNPRIIKLGVGALLLVAALAVFMVWLTNPIVGQEAYIAESNVTVWSRLSQVREPVATPRYGERVAVLDHKNDQVQVRTVSGAVGWTEQRHLMEAALWHRAADLLARASGLPVQARAHTRVPTNVRVEPGREGARIFQFPGAVPLEILERAVVEVKPGAEEPGQANSSGEEEVKKEDWVFVRGTPEDTGEVAGWVLRRFIDLDTPPEIADYSSGFRFVAWFELNRVADGDKIRPEYLAAGVQGGDGQPCDFTLLRVYTWGAERRRYETAYIEGRLCGHFPIQAQAATPGRDAGFSFTNDGKSGRESREYQMHQTSVHRIDLQKRRRTAAPRPHN